MPGPWFLGPQSHLPAILKKLFHLRAVLEAVAAFCFFFSKAFITCGVIVCVLSVGMQGTMPGSCQGHGTPPAIVLGATGGSFLAKEEMEKHCEMAP